MEHSHWLEQAHRIDLWLFHALAAGYAAQPAILGFAMLTAQASVWLILALMLASIVRHPRQALDWMAALALAGCASLLAHHLAKWIGSPRPFVLDLSPMYLPHGARGGFPSSHASAFAALTSFLLARPGLRRAGWIALPVTLAMGWARMYLGIHFPLDILAGFAFGSAIGLAGALAWHIVARCRVAHRNGELWPFKRPAARPAAAATTRKPG